MMCGVHSTTDKEMQESILIREYLTECEACSASQPKKHVLARRDVLSGVADGRIISIEVWKAYKQPVKC